MTAADPRRAAFEIVAAAVAAGLPIPQDVSITDFRVFEVQVMDNDTAAADAWIAHLGLPAPTLSSVMRAARDFRCYQARTDRYPALPGWRVEVCSFVDEPTKAVA